MIISVQPRGESPLNPSTEAVVFRPDSNVVAASAVFPYSMSVMQYAQTIIKNLFDPLANILADRAV